MNTGSARLWFLVAFLTVCVLGSAQTHHSRRHTAKPRHAGRTPNQLRKDLDELKNKKEQLKKQLRDTKIKKQSVLTDIYAVDERLNTIQDELEKTTSRLEDSRLEQHRLSKELKSATSKLDSTRDQVRARMRHMYVHGQASFVSALVGSKSVGDVASRRFLMQMIAKKDRQLFQSYQELRAAVSTRKTRQDALVIRIRTLANEQASQRSNLQDTRDEKGEVLENLKSQQGKIQNVLAQYESDERDIAAQIAEFARRKRRPGEKELPAFHGRFERPVSGQITSGYGMRYHPILHFTRLHAGVDFHASAGTPIHAAADGEVISARYSTSFGNMVIIDHGGGISTLYAHCSRLLVGSGQMVHRGQTIAASGATGLAAGPHLHFEVRVNGHTVNPRSWF